MSWEDKMITSIQQAAGTFNKDIVSIIVCNVDAISEDGFSCTCSPISTESSAPIEGVKLNAEANDGFVIIPAVDSTVMVATSTRNDYYVYMYSDIQKVQCVIDDNNSFTFDASGFIWNDGTLGGLIKIADLVTKVNNIETKINNILGLFASWTPVPNDGGAALKTLYTAGASSTLANLTLTNRTDIEDTKIKH